MNSSWLKSCTRWIVKRRDWFWPHSPLALFLVASGALNLLSGFHADFLGRFSEQLSASGLQSAGSLAALGSGAQIILGAGLLLSGVALFWKLRVAWLFSVMLLAVTIALNIGRGHYGASLIVPAVAFILLLVLGRHFRRQTVLGSALMSSGGILGVLAYGTFGLFLLGDQFDPPIKSLLTSLYFTIETLSTVGYGDYTPVTPMAQGYMITLIVVGLSVFATAVFSILGPALSHHFDNLFKPSGVRIVKKDHVIIVGAGAMAVNTVEEMARRKIPFVQIVPPGGVAPHEDFPCINGDASSAQVLDKAGLAQARLVIVAGNNDDENAFVVLAIKDIRPDAQILAVANSAEAARRLKLAHADQVFAPMAFGGRLLAGLAQGEAMPEAFHDLLK